MGMLCGRCGKLQQDSRELMTHDCPAAPVTWGEMKEFLKDLEGELQKKLPKAAEAVLMPLAKIIDEQAVQIAELRLRVEQLEKAS